MSVLGIMLESLFAGYERVYEGLLQVDDIIVRDDGFLRVIVRGDLLEGMRIHRENTVFRKLKENCK